MCTTSKPSEQVVSLLIHKSSEIHPSSLSLYWNTSTYDYVGFIFSNFNLCLPLLRVCLYYLYLPAASSPPRTVSSHDILPTAHIILQPCSSGISPLILFSMQFLTFHYICWTYYHMYLKLSAPVLTQVNKNDAWEQYPVTKRKKYPNFNVAAFPSIIDSNTSDVFSFVTVNQVISM